MKNLARLFQGKDGNMAGMAIGIAIILIVGIIAAIVFFNVSEEVPRTSNASNETIAQFTSYAKLAFGFIGLGAFVGWERQPLSHAEQRPS